MTLEMEIRKREKKALEQGLKQGRDSVLDLVREIRSGKQRDVLIAEGADPQTVDLAFEALK